jgi:hypothetical protein
MAAENALMIGGSLEPTPRTTVGQATAKKVKFNVFKPKGMIDDLNCIIEDGWAGTNTNEGTAFVPCYICKSNYAVGTTGICVSFTNDANCRTLSGNKFSG